MHIDFLMLLPQPRTRETRSFRNEKLMPFSSQTALVPPAYADGGRWLAGEQEEDGGGLDILRTIWFI